MLPLPLLLLYMYVAEPWCALPLTLPTDDDIPNKTAHTTKYKAGPVRPCRFVTRVHMLRT